MDTKNQLHKLHYTNWTVTESQLEPEHLHARETVFTIGNGYLGTRGTFEEGYPNALAVTLIHGVYDEVPIVYTELANCPDWLPLSVIVDGDRFRLEEGKILSYQRQLDLKKGILSRKVRWRSPNQKTIDIYFERFASQADQHILAVRTQVTPIDFEGAIEIQASINGYPENQGFNHWEWQNQGKSDRGMWLHLRTRKSRIQLGMACGIKVSGTEASVQLTSPPGYPTLSTAFTLKPGQTVTVDKLVAVFTSREVENPVQAAKDKLAQLPDYSTLCDAHQQTWQEIWHQSDIIIEGDISAQLAIRYNLFQLLIASPRHDDKVSIPAKTLSGFGYRGHVFWDTEIFILPFFTFTQPKIARNLLTYRYHTLNGARRKASHYGYKGAMFAWESADTGDEVTPRWALPNQPYGEEIRIWCRDLEIHISADVAYAAWHYWQTTGDDEWMRDYGAELILDSAVFWMSRVEWNTKQERYEIHDVIGADEYHDRVNNNTFTNRMGQWHLEKAIAVYDWLLNTYPDRFAELKQKLNLKTERRSRWQDIVDNILIHYDSSTGLIEQFDGFFKLEDINLEDYEPRTISMHSVLGIEGANKRQVLKQPDVLMLLYLMRESQEFPYSQSNLEINWNYYAPRTDITYGSSLGPSIHAILAADLGLESEAYKLFLQAALVDLEDTRKNAAEGIHGASAGGIWQAVVFGFGGIKLTENGPIANPHFPPSWRRLQFKLHWRGNWHEFDLHSTSSANAMNSHISAFIFDLDGVLTDTAEYHYLAWQRLADEEGFPFDREANEALRGISRRESLLLIIGEKELPEDKLLEMMERKNRYYVESIQNISPADLLPGALNLLDELKEARIKIAIGSASKNAQTVIEKLGIADRVDAISDGYSVDRPKPAPDLFLHAAQQLDLPPEKCVVVEDAAAGIQAALAARMRAIGLGPVERVGEANVVLPSLAGVHWSDLEEKLSAFS
ncbi:MAG TPA: beta-phosphoglucomutase [Leptolyngbyaceae cyanobacterium]